jgi:hypothetical protein
MKRIEATLAILVGIAVATPSFAWAGEGSDSNVPTTERRKVPSGAPSSDRTRKTEEAREPATPPAPRIRPAESPPPSTEAALPVLPDGGGAPPTVAAPLGN